jgi:hypothetical protein
MASSLPGLAGCPYGAVASIFASREEKIKQLFEEFAKCGL